MAVREVKTLPEFVLPTTQREKTRPFTEWKEYALKTPIDKLNPTSNFNDDLASEKTVVTHRIVNLMNLTEVHET